MIPLKLSLQNFLSYGPTVQTIDFVPYRLICLSGKNGHGKSALLDGLTWALWGHARKTASSTKPDQGLLRLGQTEMMVCLDFIFNGQGYRVRRLFSIKYGKPHAHVDFGTYNPETQAYVSLTEKTIRKTQEKIEQTIGLDYEAFINSSFLRQGQSNEFSKKLPKERKEVLATILGLNRYEKAKKQALEKIRALTQEKEKLHKISDHLLQEIQHLSTVQEKIEQISQSLNTCQQQETNLNAVHLSLSEEKELLQKKQSEYSLLHFESEQLAKQIQQEEVTLHKVVAQWKKSHKESINLPDKTKLEREKTLITQELVAAQSQYHLFLEKKEQYLAYKSREQELSATVHKEQEQALQEKKWAIERLNNEHTLLKTKIKELEKSIAITQKEQADCQKMIDDLHATSTDAALLISDTATLEKQFERQKTFYLKWVEQGKRATLELQSLEHKQQLAQDIDNPSCSLCEQNLSQARKRFLSKKFEHQHLFATHRIARLRELLKELKSAIEKQKHALEISKKIDALLLVHTTCITTQTDLLKTVEATKHTLTTLEVTVKDAQTALATAQEKAHKALTEHPDYKVIKQEQAACELILKATVNHPAIIKNLTEKLTALESHMQQWNNKDEQRAVQKERRITTHTHCQKIRALASQKKLLKQKMILFASLQHEYQQLITKDKDYADQVTQVTKEKGLLLQEKGKLAAELKKVEHQIEQHKQFAQQSTLLQQEIHDYQLLAQAFGKDGIQALLIEDALPEIEQEANDLLSRLTDNQAHIFIESLRDLKKGGVKETLDINISDNSGIRPYELFSGGEAFRIDFSLRIAVSKLLARRAGTSLQTLIIDEGFGSQDEEGLSRIMEALYAIQNDFEKIIIVSHLSTMKDQFPVHFYIEKGPHGSSTTVKEQG